MKIAILKHCLFTSLTALGFLCAGCFGPESWHYFSPQPLQFDLQDSVQYLKFETDGYGAYEWTVTPEDPWITVAPRDGSTNGSLVFNHSVRVDKSMPAGLHSGVLTIKGKGVAERKFNFDHTIEVLSFTGAVIFDPVVESNSELDSLFECADSNASSGFDYWGVFRKGGETSIWCNGRGLVGEGGIYGDHYDSDMEAWMALKPEHKFAVGGHERIHIGFGLICKTAGSDDYFEAFLMDENDLLYPSRDARAHWSGELGYDPILTAVDLNRFDVPAQADSLRIAFLSHF